MIETAGQSKKHRYNLVNFNASFAFWVNYTCSVIIVHNYMTVLFMFKLNFLKVFIHKNILVILKNFIVAYSKHFIYW